MPECPHNDPPTDRIVPDPTARIPVGDAARTPRWPIPYRVFPHRSGRYPDRGCWYFAQRIGDD